MKKIAYIDVTFADSFTRRELKVNEFRHHRDGRVAFKGVGEKRIYAGHEEDALDKFFDWKNLVEFFILKSDLKEYAALIVEEYKHPHFPYGEGIDETYAIFREYLQKLASLKEDRLSVHFHKTYDKQNRYYLVLDRARLNHLNYSYIYDVCLPRVSRLHFIKFVDDNGKVFVEIKPIYRP